MRAGIKREYLRCGIFPAERVARGPLHERVIGCAQYGSCDFFDADEWFLWNIPSGALELHTQKQLHVPIKNVVPPQYAIFDLVSAPATIFNFNLDGLASTFCSNKHKVLEPHGHIDAVWFENDQYQTWLYATAAHDLVLPHIVRKLLPAPEPLDMLLTKPYRIARRLFSQSGATLIIGYSFASWNGALDDFRSFEFIVDLLRANPRPVFVVSPFPEELADVLRQHLSSNGVVGMPLYWETFATTLLAMSGRNGVDDLLSNVSLRELIYRYEHAVDQR
jgi:hypothetical protein